MKFSQRTDYALRALVELGRRHGTGPTACREVARVQKIPPRFCEQVFADLKKAGMICIQRGATGGASLCREPEDIRVSEVVDVIEGPVVTQACLDPFDDEARTQAHSAVQEMYLDLQITIRERLASVTLADLIRRQEELDQSSYLVFQI
jgi:Rrf2 family protein